MPSTRVLADFLEDAGPERDAGNVDGEGRFVTFGYRVVVAPGNEIPFPIQLLGQVQKFFLHAR